MKCQICDIMAIIVGLILVSLFSYSCAIQEYRPWARLVYIDNPDTWNQTVNFPESDSFCGIEVHVTAKWKTAPETDGEYSVEFTFEHPNFVETKTFTMKIPKDQEESIRQVIHICFSRCPTSRSEMVKDTFRLDAKTDNIEKKNPIDVDVRIQKSYRDHSKNCFETETWGGWISYELYILRILVSVYAVYLLVGFMILAVVVIVWYRYGVKVLLGLLSNILPRIFRARLQNWLRPQPEGLPGPGGPTDRSGDQDVGGGPSNVSTNETSAIPLVPLSAGVGRSRERNNRNARDKRGKKSKDE